MSAGSPVVVKNFFLRFSRVCNNFCDLKKKKKSSRQQEGCIFLPAKKTIIGRNDLTLYSLKLFFETIYTRNQLLLKFCKKKLRKSSSGTFSLEISMMTLRASLFSLVTNEICLHWNCCPQRKKKRVDSECVCPFQTRDLLTLVAPLSFESSYSIVR